MSSSLTAILWQSRATLAEANLFGRPVWHWTLEAVRPLGPDRILRVTGRKAPTAMGGVQSLTSRRIATALGGRENVALLLAAELPCIRSSSLKRLVAASRSGPRFLASPPETGRTNTGGEVLCVPASVLKKALLRRDIRAGSLEAMGTLIDARPASLPYREELLLVRSLANLAEAAQILRRRKCQELLAKGVLLDDPSSVHIDPNVQVGRGTRIQGWVVIEGETRIGGNCIIGSFSHIIDSEIGSGTVVLDHCFVRSSRVGKAAQLGPFSHLRPDSVIGAGAKVGNFVELKKTFLGRGSKAPHLTYLGDATIGKGVNVGAGTITCNYDGRLKHPTIVEDGAFIGSDVQLVAPVRVGRGAYVAAGSCIVDDVPAEALALARSRQVIKPGWARRQGKKSHPRPRKS